MATQLVWSGAGGTPDGGVGGNWDNAWTSIESISALSSGDIVLVHTGSTSTHLENQSHDISISGPSVGVAYILGVDKDVSDTVIHESATDNITTITGSYQISFNGGLEVQGLHFKSNERFVFLTGDRDTDGLYIDCRFEIITTNYFYLGNVNRSLNCDFVMGTGGYFQPVSGAIMYFNGGSITGSASYLFNGSAGHHIIGRGVDMSGYTGANFVSFSNVGIIMEFYGCRKPSSFTTSASYNGDLRWWESSTTTGVYSSENDQARIGETTIVTGVYRDSGGTYDGSNNYSIQIAATSSSTIANPCYTDWQQAYVPADSGTTTVVTVFIANTSGTLNDDDAWLEIEYFGTSGNTLKTILSNRIESIQATPAAITSDGSSTWTGITETAQKLVSSAVTIQNAGMLRWRVASTFSTANVYVCPKVSIVQS